MTDCSRLVWPNNSRSGHRGGTCSHTRNRNPVAYFLVNRFSGSFVSMNTDVVLWAHKRWTRHDLRTNCWQEDVKVKVRTARVAMCPAHSHRFSYRANFTSYLLLYHLDYKIAFFYAVTESCFITRNPSHYRHVMV
jgi:hypothetical protein